MSNKSLQPAAICYFEIPAPDIETHEYVNAIKQEGENFRRHLDGLVAALRPSKPRSLETLVPKRVAGPVPVEKLHAVLCSPDKDKQIATVIYPFKLVADDGRKAVDRSSHVDSVAMQENGIEAL